MGADHYPDRSIVALDQTLQREDSMSDLAIKRKSRSISGDMGVSWVEVFREPKSTLDAPMGVTVTGA